MVAHPRTSAGTDALRPLNQPKPLTVLLDAEEERAATQPRTLVEHGVQRRILQIQDTWRIDDEWWRAPIARRYYLVLLEDDSLRTIYHDLVTGQWYAQAY